MYAQSKQDSNIVYVELWCNSKYMHINQHGELERRPLDVQLYHRSSDVSRGAYIGNN